VDRAFVALTGIGLTFVFAGIVMRGRAWSSRRAGNTERRAGDSELFRRIEEEALRYARLGLSIGIPLAIVGMVGWVVTEWIH
jgi:hypothetical protein